MPDNQPPPGAGAGSSKAEETTGTAPAPEWTPELEDDYRRLLSVGEECITADELRSLVLNSSANDTGFRLYDGFEPSGRMHIAQGVFKAMNVNKCTRSGGTFVFWVADWFALMNDKMGGDLSKIQTTGKYLIEVWKAAGMDISDDNVVFKWASEEITDRADVYWPTMLDVARRFNVTRIKKCCQIMGRLEGGLTAAQILYPLMQCTDVFFLKADICQLGVDQRKVNMLAREYCDYLSTGKRKKRKPVILSHHMLYGLKAGQEKMSKSDPDSAIFMEDTSEDVRRKIMAAYCPSKPEESSAVAAGAGDAGEEDAGKSSMHLVQDDLKNPCLDYVENIVFSRPDATFSVPGVGQPFGTFDDVRQAFLSGAISETQLKEGLIEELNTMLQPVRDHFIQNEYARDLLAQVRQFKKEANTSILSEFRRLDICGLDASMDVPPNTHLVFAPLPTTKPGLQLAVDVLAQIRACPAASTKTVLFLSDWSARVQNSCDADEKVILAFYDVLVCCLRTLDPIAMENVVVLKQSEAILKDPSNYWISVINIGRHFVLEDVMGDAMKDSDGVGRVIARLMRVADALALNPSSIAFPPPPARTTSSDAEDTCDADSKVEMSMISNYLSLSVVVDACGAPPVVLQAPSLGSLVLHIRELEAHKTDNDEYFLLDDPKVHGKSKMKKAFCEPGNTSFCPPIAVVSAFTFSDMGGDPSGEKKVTVGRSEANGGDVTYASRGEVEADFAGGKLHPGDLKAASSVLMVQILETLSNGIKADPNANKAAKSLKAFEKKISKSKSKGGKK